MKSECSDLKLRNFLQGDSMDSEAEEAPKKYV